MTYDPQEPGAPQERSWGMVFLGMVTAIVGVGIVFAVWVSVPILGFVSLGVIAGAVLWLVLTNRGRGFGLGLLLGIAVVPIVAGGICIALLNSMNY